METLWYNVGVYGYIRVRTLSVVCGIRSFNYNADKREVTKNGKH